MKRYSAQILYRGAELCYIDVEAVSFVAAEREAQRLAKLAYPHLDRFGVNVYFA